jgi:hypothetical protein
MIIERMIVDLVVGAINFSSKTLSARVVNFNEIDVSFKLAVPVWCNDKDFIGNKDNHSVVYAKNNKKCIARLEIKLSDVDGSYPKVSNNKFFVIRKKYNIVEWCKDGSNFIMLLNKEREVAFREIRSNIVLEQIGDLTKKWTDITDGKWHNGAKFNYGLFKYSDNMENFNCFPRIKQLDVAVQSF